jgi:hypothetical protein
MTGTARCVPGIALPNPGGMGLVCPLPETSRIMAQSARPEDMKGEPGGPCHTPGGSGPYHRRSEMEGQPAPPRGFEGTEGP